MTGLGPLQHPYIHEPSGIRTHNPSVRAVKDRTLDCADTEILCILSEKLNPCLKV
jgi:hypothetical protein